MVTQQIVITATYDVASDDKDSIMATLDFQWCFKLNKTKAQLNRVIPRIYY